MLLLVRAITAFDRHLQSRHRDRLIRKGEEVLKKSSINYSVRVRFGRFSSLRDMISSSEKMELPDSKSSTTMMDIFLLLSFCS